MHYINTTHSSAIQDFSVRGTKGHRRQNDVTTPPIPPLLLYSLQRQNTPTPPSRVARPPVLSFPTGQLRGVYTLNSFSRVVLPGQHHLREGAYILNPLLAQLAGGKEANNSEPMHPRQQLPSSTTTQQAGRVADGWDPHRLTVAHFLASSCPPPSPPSRREGSWWLGYLQGIPAICHPPPLPPSGGEVKRRRRIGQRPGWDSEGALSSLPLAGYGPPP